MISARILAKLPKETATAERVSKEEIPGVVFVFQGADETHIYFRLALRRAITESEATDIVAKTRFYPLEVRSDDRNPRTGYWCADFKVAI